MKTLALFWVFVCIFVGLRAQELNTILLHLPDVKRGLPVMTALEQRRSTREYSEKRLELQDLSDLLWAAVGVNRPESGKRTAPSALNRQEIEYMFVCLKEHTGMMLSHMPCSLWLKGITGRLLPAGRIL